MDDPLSSSSSLKLGPAPLARKPSGSQPSSPRPPLASPRPVANQAPLFPDRPEPADDEPVRAQLKREDTLKVKPRGEGTIKGKGKAVEPDLYTVSLPDAPHRLGSAALLDELARSPLPPLETSLLLLRQASSSESTLTREVAALVELLTKTYGAGEGEVERCRVRARAAPSVEERWERSVVVGDGKKGKHRLSTASATLDLDLQEAMSETGFDAHSVDDPPPDSLSTLAPVSPHQTPTPAGRKGIAGFRLWASSPSRAPSPASTTVATAATKEEPARRSRASSTSSISSAASANAGPAAWLGWPWKAQVKGDDVHRCVVFPSSPPSAHREARERSRSEAQSTTSASTSTSPEPASPKPAEGKHTSPMAALISKWGPAESVTTAPTVQPSFSTSSTDAPTDPQEEEDKPVEDEQMLSPTPSSDTFPGTVRRVSASAVTLSAVAAADKRRKGKGYFATARGTLGRALGLNASGAKIQPNVTVPTVAFGRLGPVAAPVTPVKGGGPTMELADIGTVESKPPTLGGAVREEQVTDRYGFIVDAKALPKERKVDEAERTTALPTKSQVDVEAELDSLREALGLSPTSSPVAPKVETSPQSVKRLLGQLNEMQETLERSQVEAWDAFIRKRQAKGKSEGWRDSICLHDDNLVGVATMGRTGKQGKEDWREFKDLVRRGVPVALRPKIWAECSGATERREPGYYQDLLSVHSGETGLALDQIECDVTRSVSPQRPALELNEGQDAADECLLWWRRTGCGPAQKGPDGHVVAQPRRRLLPGPLLSLDVVARLNAEQGMNMVAGTLLLTLPTEEDAFWVLACIIEVRSHFADGCSELTTSSGSSLRTITRPISWSRKPTSACSGTWSSSAYPTSPDTSRRSTLSCQPSRAPLSRVLDGGAEAKQVWVVPVAVRRRAAHADPPVGPS